MSKFIILKKLYRNIAFFSFLLFILTITTFILYNKNSDVEYGIPSYYFSQVNNGVSKKNILKQKEVYLTFDDGPSSFTPKILEILKEYDVKATFFVIGNTGYQKYMKDIVDQGHSIGLHSYNHKFKQIYKSEEAFFEDLQKIDDLVFEQTGLHSKIMRFPGGSSVNVKRSFMKQLCAEVQIRGYQYFDWNSETGDAAGASSTKAAISHLKKSPKINSDEDLVVLMHDTRKVTLKALPELIEYFKDMGCQFKALTPNTPAVHHTLSN